MTNPPPVAPVEGHYALLRNGMVVKHLVDMWDAHRGPKTKRDYWTAHPDTDFSDLCWHEDGKSRDDSDYDIIATISPADMQAVANGELERLQQEHAFMKDQIQKLDQIMTNSIKENDGPNRVNIDGVWYEGPVVENYFNVLGVMQKAYRLVLERVS